MRKKDFDVIIIGAGPAGSACAYTLAKAGKAVLIVERGDFPGAKNVTGGRIYAYALEQLEPGLYTEAPLERSVVCEQVIMLDGDRSITIDYQNSAAKAGAEMSTSFTVLRSKFDRWLAQKAEEMGAVQICGIRVDDLIQENGEVIGIVAGGEMMHSDVVVAADGVNSIMAQKAGLIADISKHSVGVGVKEIIEMSPKTINSRFNLQDKEGTARLILGCTEGIHCGAFLYTNVDSVSLGAIYAPEEVAGNGKSVQQLFQELKMHPAVYPLISGGRTVEYAAHLVGEEGYRGTVKKLHKEGFLIAGDAAGFVIHMGYNIHGMDLAILSGIAAAKAITAGTDQSRVGTAYEKELGRVLLPAMKAIYEHYFTGVFAVEGLLGGEPV